MENSSAKTQSKQVTDTLLRSKRSFKWIFWNQFRFVLFLIFGAGFAFYGGYLLISLYARMVLEEAVKKMMHNNPNKELNEAVSNLFLNKLFPIHIELTVQALTISLCCFIIARMFNKIIVRNRYISDLESALKADS